MTRLFNCGVLISVSVLLHGCAALTSNTSPQDQPLNVTAGEDVEDTGWELLQLRANLLSFSQPLHPYTLLTNTDDYNYMPKPRHRRPSRLLRLLGSSFDPFWMSIEQPPEVADDQPWLRGDTASTPEYTKAGERFNLSASPVLREAAESHRQKLEKAAAELDLRSLPSHVAGLVRDWLVRSASCELTYQWVDVGPLFWPHWLRQTDCEKSYGERSCSFPGGMECVKAQTTYIKILAWLCLEVRDASDGSKGIKSDRGDGSTELGTGDVIKRCMWKKVPYPVVTACACSCK